ncbi:MAG: S-layer protein [Archaeoglobaceae archaeon]
MRVALLFLLLLAAPVMALDYEEKPNVSVANVLVFNEFAQQFVPTNHVGKGEKIVQILVFNDAKREKLEYDDVNEAMFFSDESALFTAYNVRFELEGDGVEVLTPPVYLPALPPKEVKAEPVPLTFRVKFVEPGEHELKLKVTYFIIDDVYLGQAFPPVLMPKTDVTSISYRINDPNNATVTNQTTREYVVKLQSYEIKFVRVEKEVRLKFTVEEDVRLEIVDAEQNAVFGIGKGELRLKIRNAGEKVARNSYLVVSLPRGFGSQTQASPGLPTMSMQIPMQVSQMQMQTPSSGELQYFVGDLQPGAVRDVSLRFDVSVEEPGNYTLTLKLRYVDEFGNVRETKEVPVGFLVEEKPKFSVEIVSGVHVNSKGKVRAIVNFNRDLKGVSLELRTSPPLSVLSSECYIGDVAAGEDYECEFVVQASDEASPTTYPAELVVSFVSGGETFELEPVTIGIEVKPRIEFGVEGLASIAAGEEAIVEFYVVNLGNVSVSDATARLTIVDPFSSTDDTAYLGDMQPGEKKVARFKLAVDRDATPKVYGLNLEVKYRDASGEWVYSEPVKALVEVQPAKPPYGMLAVVAIVLIAAVAYYLKRR